MLTIRVWRNEGGCGHHDQDERGKKAVGQDGGGICGCIGTWCVNAQETLGTQGTQGPNLHGLPADIPPSKTGSC